MKMCFLAFRFQTHIQNVPFCFFLVSKPILESLHYLQTIMIFFLSCPGLFQTKSSRVPTMAKDGKDPFSLRRIPSVWINSWRRPSSMAAPRGLPPAAGQRTTTTTRNAGRSEFTRAVSPCRAAALVLQDGRRLRGVLYSSHE